MLHPSTKKLIDRLCEMTIQRKIDWVSGDQADTLAYDTEGYRVLLEGNPAALVLCDALGNELDRADHDALSATQHIDHGTYETLMETMRSEATRIARGAEDAIASVLGGLDLDGDGIPDVPAPIELEDAPEGVTSEAFDDVEDTVDELAGLDSQSIQSEALPEIEGEAEAVFQNDTPMPLSQDQNINSDDGIDPAMDTAPAFDTSTLAAADLDALTPQEDTSASMMNAAPTAADWDSEPNEPDDAFDDTPDVGEAVANLANQVNNTSPAPEPAAENEIPATDQPAPRPSPPRAKSLITSGMGFNALPSSRGRGMVLQSSTPIHEDKSDQAAPATEETSPAAPATSEPTIAVPKPGQVLSLSGLTDNIEFGETDKTGALPTDPVFEVEATPEPEPAPSVDPAPVVPDVSPEPIAPPPEPSAADSSGPAPALEEATPEADPEKDQPPPKRFNPWI